MTQTMKKHFCSLSTEKLKHTKNIGCSDHAYLKNKSNEFEIEIIIMDDLKITDLLTNSNFQM